MSRGFGEGTSAVAEGYGGQAFLRRTAGSARPGGLTVHPVCSARNVTLVRLTRQRLSEAPIITRRSFGEGGTLEAAAACEHAHKGKGAFLKTLVKFLHADLPAPIVPECIGGGGMNTMDDSCANELAVQLAS